MQVWIYQRGPSAIKFLYFFELQIDIFEIEGFIQNTYGNCHAYLGIGYKPLKL